MSLAVIIPVFNNIEGVLYTLSLVKKRTPKVLQEIIIIDDCSTDDLSSVVSDFIESDCYLSELVKIVTISENKGANFCRRLGLRLSSCKYIMFLDSDDKLDFDFFERVSDSVFSGFYDFIFCSVDYYRDNKEILKINPSLTHSEKKDDKKGSHLLFVDNFSGVGVQTSAWIIRKSLVRSNFWKLYLPGHQDWFFIMAFFERNPFCKTYFCPHAVVERHTYSNRDHISKKLNFNYSYGFFKENIRFFSFSSSLFFLTTVCALKAIKAKGILLPLGCSIFTINIVRKPFWRYAFCRLRSKYFNDK